jgi:hypothetical protein
VEKEQREQRAFLAAGELDRASALLDLEQPKIRKIIAPKLTPAREPF